MENMLSMLSNEEANFILDSLFNKYGFDRWKFDFNTRKIRLWKKDDDFSCYWLGYESNGSWAVYILLEALCQIGYLNCVKEKSFI